MAFTKSTWALDGSNFNSNVPRIHKYTSSTDAIATMNTAAYFNDVSAEVSVGDQIYTIDSAGVATILYVLSNAAGVVDTNDGTTLAATDID